MTKKQVVLGVLLMVWGFGAGRAAQPRLCPTRIASLLTTPGNLDALTVAQRVEIRRCAVQIDKGRGTFQLVAWPKGAEDPGLIFETEDSGFYQFAMIEGVYVIELMGGHASRVVVLTFRNNEPSIALDVTSRLTPSIYSTRAGIVVEVPTVAAKLPERFTFRRQATGEGRR